MTKLLFAPEVTQDQDEPMSAASSSRASSVANANTNVGVSPLDRYYMLSPADRIAILSFMCNVAVTSKSIHMHMDTCEEQLTALRKEKIEMNRNRKQLYVASAIHILSKSQFPVVSRSCPLSVTSLSRPVLRSHLIVPQWQ